MRSKGPRSAAAMLHATNAARRQVRAAAHCRARQREPRRLMSLPTPKAFGSSVKSASRIAPEPVPISTMRKARDRGPRAFDGRERRLDDRFRLRPRHQRRGIDAKLQAPEFLEADNARYRFMGEAALGQGSDRVCFVGGRGAADPKRQARHGRGKAHGRPGAGRRAPAISIAVGAEVSPPRRAVRRQR